MRKSVIIVGGIGVIVVGGLFSFLYEPHKEVSVQREEDAPVEIKIIEKSEEAEGVNGEKAVGESFPIESEQEDVEEPYQDAPSDQGGGESEGEVEKEASSSSSSKQSVDYSPSISVKKNLISWGHEKARDRDIFAVILHSSYNSLGEDKYDTDAIIGIYKSYGVGAHYIIERDGDIVQLVDEENIAYHAGISRLPNGVTDVNGVSIGIEIVTSDASDDEPTSEEYDAVERLLKDIQSRYNIKYVLGHNDIASGRKTDPWNFDWNKIK